MISTRIVSAFAIAVSAGLGVGCSSSSSDTPSGGGGSGGSAGTLTSGGTSGTGASGGSAGSVSGGTGGGGPTCDPAPGHSTSDDSHHIVSLNGTILDTDGQPAKKTSVLLCGVDVCAPPGSTDDQGKIVTCDGQTGVCALGITPLGGVDEKVPAMKYGDGLDYAKFVLRLDTSGGLTDYDMGTNATIKLPAIASGAAFVPGGDAVSGNITLTLPAGGVATVDELEYDTPETQRFRAAAIPGSQAPAAVDASQNFELIVATTPVDTELCPAAKLTVPNLPGWAADTPVEFWVHGVDVGNEPWAPYGGWAKMSDGTVSSDGTTVSTDDGQGIRTLSVFGVKKK